MRFNLDKSKARPDKALQERVIRAREQAEAIKKRKQATEITAPSPVIYFGEVFTTKSFYFIKALELFKATPIN